MGANDANCQRVPRLVGYSRGDDLVAKLDLIRQLASLEQQKNLRQGRPSTVLNHALDLEHQHSRVIALKVAAHAGRGRKSGAANRMGRFRNFGICASIDGWPATGEARGSSRSS